MVASPSARTLTASGKALWKESQSKHPFLIDKSSVTISIFPYGPIDDSPSVLQTIRTTYFPSPEDLLTQAWRCVYDVHAEINLFITFRDLLLDFPAEVVENNVQFMFKYALEFMTGFVGDLGGTHITFGPALTGSMKVGRTVQKEMPSLQIVRRHYDESVKGVDMYTAFVRAKRQKNVLEERLKVEREGLGRAERGRE